MLWGDLVASYRALTGIDYPPNKRAEAGDIIDDLPGKSIKWLTACGAIEKSDGKSIVEEVVEEVEEEIVEEEIVEEDDDDDAVISAWGAKSVIEDDEGDDD